MTQHFQTLNLPVRRPQVSNGENGHLDERAVDHNQETRNQGSPAVDDVNGAVKQRVVRTPPF
jgi:hypothetical protein